MDTLPQKNDIKSIKKVLITKPDHFELVKEVYTPEIPDGHFLAKVCAAPINPTDLIRMKGFAAQFPFTLGAECAGVVIYPEDLRGKNVAFQSFNGCYATYAIGKIEDAIFFPDKVDFNQIACAWINPLTAIGLIETAKKLGAKSLINCAANSQLGQKIYRLSQAQNIQTINLVRTDKRVKEFKETLKAEYVQDIQSPTFTNDLKNLAEKLDAKVCFECYGGELGSTIFNTLPNRGVLICYGILTGPKLQIDIGSLLWNVKEVKAFNVYQWVQSHSKDEKEKIFKQVIDKYDQFFTSKIAGEHPIEKFGEALEKYKSDMGSGKHILKM